MSVLTPSVYDSALGAGRVGKYPTSGTHHLGCDERDRVMMFRLFQWTGVCLIDAQGGGTVYTDGRVVDTTVQAIVERLYVRD
jgi:uncharacterized protein YeaC (DUF1315 family)